MLIVGIPANVRCSPLARWRDCILEYILPTKPKRPNISPRLRLWNLYCKNKGRITDVQFLLIP
ncbi:hypothetical protein FXO09_07370 [Microcystis aeruginosa KLA2]|nr:MAG: hypothetical protein EWV62_14710 [Microcystis aeruginosa Ma_OC_LR_19540900_S633]TRU06205.1 MAG: hypothetical protein EWV59_20400 [Microcystis aeruginosa Ma_MB_F_20061100_S19D]TYT71839.1 hypothetical protein FXO09_07370 [Microcystis aeruginosa KLA2]